MGPVPLDSVAEEACTILQDELTAKLPGMFVCFVKMLLPDEDKPIVFGKHAPYTIVVHLREPYGESMPALVPCVELQGRPRDQPEYSENCVMLVCHADYYAMYDRSPPHPFGSASEAAVYKEGLSPKQLADLLYKFLVCEQPLL